MTEFSALSHVVSYCFGQIREILGLMHGTLGFSKSEGSQRLPYHRKYSIRFGMCRLVSTSNGLINCDSSLERPCGIIHHAALELTSFGTAGSTGLAKTENRSVRLSASLLP
jgi:hypothetical protein